jgi:hypothetical protein
MRKIFLSLSFLFFGISLFAQIHETFEGSAFPPTGWSVQRPDGGIGWDTIRLNSTPVPGFNGGFVTSLDTSNKKMVYCSYTTGGAISNNQYLITPQISIQANYNLSFWMRKFGNNADTLSVKISTTTSDVASFSSTLATIGFSVSDSGWVQYTYPLHVYTGQQIYLAFNESVHDNSVDGAALFIDNVEISTVAAIAHEENAFEFSVYPNPATDYVKIKSAKQIDQIKIYTVSGALIENTKIINETAVLPLKNYQEGIYYIQAIGKAGISTQKIVIRSHL